MLNGFYCALKNIVFRAALLLVYDPIKRRFFLCVFVLQAGHCRWRKTAREVKVQLLRRRNTTLSKAFLRHFNSFVMSACQTRLEQRIIAACTHAKQVKSISFDAARGHFVCFFFPFSHRHHRHFGLTSRCGCHGNRAIWQTWWQRSSKQRSVTKITLHDGTAL